VARTAGRLAFFKLCFEDFASGRENCWIFDFYGILADAGGNLKRSYATGSEDSHPNGSAYRALAFRFRGLFEEAGWP